MCLSLSTRSKSNTRNSITSHNRNTICRECPFISKRTSFSHFLCFCVSKTSFPIKVLISILKSLSYLMILRNSPCREVALDLIFASCIRRSVVFLHRNNYIIAIFLNARKSTDLIQAAFPCFSECHTTVKRYCTGVSYCTTARRGVEDLGYSYSTASKETSLFPVRQQICRR